MLLATWNCDKKCKNKKVSQHISFWYQVRRQLRKLTLVSIDENLIMSLLFYAIAALLEKKSQCRPQQQNNEASENGGVALVADGR